MFTKIIGIDFGTKTIKIYKKNKGIILNEYNIIAQDKNNNIITAGNEAYEIYERAPKTIKVSYPIKRGVIADYNNMVKLLNWYLKKTNCKKGPLSNNIAYISIPYDISEVEKKAIFDLLNDSEADIKKTYILDKPIAAALGANIDVLSSQGNMIVDIGGDTTEISVISLGGIVISKLVKIGGNQMDKSIINSRKKNNNLLIGERSAELIKINIASAYPDDSSCKVYGRDIITGLPKEIEIYSEEVYKSIKVFLFSIIDSIKFILEKTPPEISSDIIDSGIFLTGGGALIKRFDDLIYEETGLVCNVVDSPIESVVRGLGKVIEKTQSYKDIISIPKQRRYKYYNESQY